MNRESRRREIVDVRAVIRAETDRAWLLWDGNIQEWVPKSQGQDNRDGTFSMPEWMATEKGFI